MAWNLTNPALQYDSPPILDSATGLPVQAPPQTAFFKNKALRAMQFAHDAAQQAQPGTATVNGSIGEPSVAPGAEMLPGPVSASVPSSEYSPGQDQTTVGQSAPPTPTFPKFIQPKFSDVSQGQNGLPTPVNAGETKLGKLLHVIRLAAEGAADGSQAGTFGGGFAAAEQGPIQKILMQQNLQQGQIQNQLGQAQIAMLPWQRMQQIAALQKSQADIGKTQAETRGLPIKQNLEEAQALNARYKEDPGSGTLIDLQTGQPVNGGQMVPVQTQEMADVLNVPRGTKVPLGRLSKAADLLTKGITNYTTEEGVFERNRINGQNKRLGASPRMVFAPANQITEVPDPDHPGQTKFVTKGAAMAGGMAGSKSASFTVPKDVLKWATTGKGGDQATAFNTALQHADLLETAMKALNNGDVQTLNSLKNRFKTEFGSPDVTNYQTIANAYGREITKMLSGGHMSDKEIETQGATLPQNASPEQIQGAIDAYRSLAGSKMQVLYERVQKGMKGETTITPQSTAPQTATGPNGHKIIVQNGKWVDAATGQPIQ